VKVFNEVRRKPRVQTEFLDESLTVQSDRFRSEIKHIMTRFEETGVMAGMREVDLAFRDVSQFSDFAELMREAEDAKQEFMRLPSKVREVFGHDHFNWLDAAHRPEAFARYRPALEELGVLEKVAKPSEPPVAPVPPVEA